MTFACGKAVASVGENAKISSAAPSGESNFSRAILSFSTSQINGEHIHFRTTGPAP